MNHSFKFYQFLNEILCQLDKGKSISILEVVDAFDNENIGEFYDQNIGFKNNNSSVEELKFVSDYILQSYVSENEAYKRGLDKNGLTYLANIILESLNCYQKEYELVE